MGTPLPSIGTGHRSSRTGKCNSVSAPWQQQQRGREGPAAGTVLQCVVVLPTVRPRYATHVTLRSLLFSDRSIVPRPPAGRLRPRALLWRATTHHWRLEGRERWRGPCRRAALIMSTSTRVDLPGWRWTTATAH